MSDNTLPDLQPNLGEPKLAYITYLITPFRQYVP
jgi:hypothetical protein